MDRGISILDDERLPCLIDVEMEPQPEQPNTTQDNEPEDTVTYYDVKHWASVQNMTVVSVLDESLQAAWEGTRMMSRFCCTTSGATVAGYISKLIAKLDFLDQCLTIFLDASTRFDTALPVGAEASSSAVDLRPYQELNERLDRYDIEEKDLMSFVTKVRSYIKALPKDMVKAFNAFELSEIEVAKSKCDVFQANGEFREKIKLVFEAMSGIAETPPVDDVVTGYCAALAANCEEKTFLHKALDLRDAISNIDSGKEDSTLRGLVGYDFSLAANFKIKTFKIKTACQGFQPRVVYF